jgi:hypothetical protein
VVATDHILPGTQLVISAASVGELGGSSATGNRETDIADDQGHLYHFLS